MNFPLSFPIGWRSLGAWSAGTASPGLAIPGLEPAAAGAPVLGPHARGCPRRSAVLWGSATRAAACVSPRGTDPLRKRPAAIARPRLLFPAARAHTEPAETPPRPRLGRIADFQMQRDARAVPSSRRHRTTRSWPQRLRGTGTAPARRPRARAGREGRAGLPTRDNPGCAHQEAPVAGAICALLGSLEPSSAGRGRALTPGRLRSRGSSSCPARVSRCALPRGTKHLFSPAPTRACTGRPTPATAVRVNPDASAHDGMAVRGHGADRETCRWDRNCRTSIIPWRCHRLNRTGLWANLDVSPPRGEGSQARQRETTQTGHTPSRAPERLPRAARETSFIRSKGSVFTTSSPRKASCKVAAQGPGTGTPRATASPPTARAETTELQATTETAQIKFKLPEVQRQRGAAGRWPGSRGWPRSRGFCANGEDTNERVQVLISNACF